jgi:predicted Zn-dependent protease
LKTNKPSTAILSQFYLELVKQLQDTFYGVVITIDFLDPPTLDQNNKADSYLINKSRNQWVSERVLEWILGKSNLTSYTKLLVISDFDAYSNGLNFVFGQVTPRVTAMLVPPPTLIDAT